MGKKTEFLEVRYLPAAGLDHLTNSLVGSRLAVGPRRQNAEGLGRDEDNFNGDGGNCPGGRRPGARSCCSEAKEKRTRPEDGKIQCLSVELELFLKKLRHGGD